MSRKPFTLAAAASLILIAVASSHFIAEKPAAPFSSDSNIIALFGHMGGAGHPNGSAHAERLTQLLKEQGLDGAEVMDFRSVTSNSSATLETVSLALKIIRPKVIAVLTGAENEANLKGFKEFLQSTRKETEGGAKDKSSASSSAVAATANAADREDLEQLALVWYGYLEAGLPAPSTLPEPELKKVTQALLAYIEKHPGHRGMPVALARLMFNAGGSKDKAYEILSKQAESDKSVDWLEIQVEAEEMAKHDAKNQRRWKSLSSLIERRRTREYTYSALKAAYLTRQLPPDPIERAKLLAYLQQNVPQETHLSFIYLLSLLQDNELDKARATIAGMIELNPFSKKINLVRELAGLYPRFPSKHQAILDKAFEQLEQRHPDEGLRIQLYSGALADWVRKDLSSILQLGRSAGVAVVLQTYPTSGPGASPSSGAINGIIVRVARDAGANLSGPTPEDLVKLLVETKLFQPGARQTTSSLRE